MQIFAVDKRMTITPHEDALVVKALIHNYMVHNILVDTGSSVNLLTLKVFNKMGLDQATLSPVTTPLVGLGGKSTIIVGSIKLEVELGEGNITKTLQTKFMVVDIPFAYNAIIGRPILNETCASIYVQYLLLKIPTSKGEAIIKGDQRQARIAY